MPEGTATAVDRLTVLTDPGCPLCALFAGWLARQATFVPVDLVAAGSPEARRLLPTLNHARTLEEVTVVGSDGSVWTHDRAWVMCLWATRAHRGLAEQLARPHLLPLARGAACSAAGVRHLLGAPGARGGDYPEACAGTCRPLPEG